MRHTHTDTADTPLVRLERDVPTNFNPGDTLTINLRLMALKPLAWLQFVDQIPEGFALIAGHPGIRAEPVAAGTTLTAEYQVRAPDASGTFPLTGTGKAEAKLGSQPSRAELLSLTSRLVTGFVYERAANELFTFERWLAPASTEPGGLIAVTVRLTAKVDLRQVELMETLPDGFRLIAGQLAVTYPSLRVVFVIQELASRRHLAFQASRIGGRCRDIVGHELNSREIASHRIVEPLVSCD